QKGEPGPNDPIPSFAGGCPKESQMGDAFNTGTLAGAGSFRCEGCGPALALRELDSLPECPECGGRSYRRALLFELEDHTVAHHDVAGAPGWLKGAREGIEEA